MKRNKAMASLAAAAAMLLAFNGTAFAEVDTAGMVDPSLAGTTLTVCYHSETFVQDENGNDVMADIFNDFTEETGINVELTYIANSDWADYTTKVQTLFASGTAPDLIYVAAENQEAFVQNGMLQPMDAYLEAHPDVKEDYESAVSEPLRVIGEYEDGTYGVLNCYETCVMWLNKNVLAEAGLEVPDANWTWEEFEEYCRVIHEKTDKYAFIMPTTYFTADGWYFSYDAGFVNDDFTEITFDSDQSKELMQFWKDAYDNGWCPGDPFGLDGPVELAAGRTAMCSVGRWGSSTCFNNEFYDVATVYLPTKYSENKISAWGFLGVSSQTDNYEAAAALAAYTAGYNFSSRYCSEVNGNIPARADVNQPDNYLFDWDGQDIFYQVNDAAIPMENPVCYAELETIWKACVTNVLSGLKDVDTAVNDAAAEMRSALG